MPGTVLEFDELGVGQQVTLNTTDRGQLIGRAVANGGGDSGFTVVEVTDASHTFNGDGSAGAVQIFPKTIVAQVEASTPAITWKFAATAVEIGWVVLFNVEGASPAEITVTDQDDVTIVIINTSFPNSESNNLVMGIYLDTDSTWRLIRSRILIP